jgi:multisubunit Na+/H+ antiporter MnhB subunit
MVLLSILLFLMIIGALIAVETRNLLSSIVCLGAVGFLLSIVFLFLGAPDLAITQLVVEILCLVILIRATIHRRVKAVAGNREFVGLAATVVMLAIVLMLSITVMSGFPRLGESVLDRMAEVPSHSYLLQGKEHTGVTNMVTAILLDFRAYDTLGEATVLFCAVIGALAVLRRNARRRPEDHDAGAASEGGGE